MSGDLVARLQSVMQPFLLRRLKKEVAEQLLGKASMMNCVLGYELT